jgi:type II secretory pathway pseudopilin PulG
MIETMIVVAIIGILVNLAVPAYMESRRRAEVASILGDYQVVRAAVSDYFLAHREWPAGAEPGEMPPELVDYLGDRVHWSTPHVYDYDYFADEAGNPTQPEAGVLVGFSLRDADPRLIALIEGARPGPLTQTWGNGVTFVIEGTESGSGPDGEPGEEPEDAPGEQDEEGNGPGPGRGRG